MFEEHHQNPCSSRLDQVGVGALGFSGADPQFCHFSGRIVGENECLLLLMPAAYV